MEKRIPYWIVKLVWSFVSDRQTTLEMPGHAGIESFFVNIGIPQGSTILPILFLLFTASLLDRFAADPNRGKVVTLFAFSDDIHVAVTMRTRSECNEKLEMVHERIMAWAKEYHVVFEPSKYAVLPFRSPQSHEPRESSDTLPNIPGLPEANNVHRILGVLVDENLIFEAHYEEVSSMHERNRNLLNDTGPEKGVTEVGIPLADQRLYLGRFTPCHETALHLEDTINHRVRVWCVVRQISGRFIFSTTVSGRRFGPITE